MDILKQLGELAIGSRLKRLSDVIMREGAEIYKNSNIEFEPKWFPIYYTLSQRESMTVTQIAEEVSFKHPTVSQTLKEMQNQGLIESSLSAKDGRKRLVSLSHKGKALLPQLEPIWKDISNVFHGMLQEHTDNLICAIEQFEKDFEQQAFNRRVEEQTKNRQLEDVEIIPFDPRYSHEFRILNEEWIEKYFTMEKEDQHILNNPVETIINDGGHILLAKFNEEIVGTCALLKVDNDHYELVKMAVTEKVRGKQIGKKLGLAILQLAKKLGAKRVSLESNKSLVPAIRLYEKLGFRISHTCTDTSAYERCDIKMEIDISN